MYEIVVTGNHIHRMISPIDFLRNVRAMSLHRNTSSDLWLCMTKQNLNSHAFVDGNIPVTMQMKRSYANIANRNIPRPFRVL